MKDFLQKLRQVYALRIRQYATCNASVGCAHRKRLHGVQSGLAVGIVGGSDLMKITEQLGADGENMCTGGFEHGRGQSVVPTGMFDEWRLLTCSCGSV